MSSAPWTFCPRCASALSSDGGTGARRRCTSATCDFVHYANPTPVVVAIVELPTGVVLARGRGWPEKVFAPISGFLEEGEDPREAVVREISEELGLAARVVSLVGVYPFAAQNQVLIAYHAVPIDGAEGDVVKGDELEEVKIIPVARLKGWPFATGLAIVDWLARRNA